MARSRWSRGRRARGRTALVLWLLLLPGCVLSSIRFGDELPGEEPVSAIAPGRTTRREVLDLLGPPEEYAQPTPLHGLRAWDPQERRVLEERDIFRRRTWTWICEHRTDHIVWLPLIFTWRDTDHQADRIVVTFNDQGIVMAVGSQRVEDAP